VLYAVGTRIKLIGDYDELPIGTMGTIIEYFNNSKESAEKVSYPYYVLFDYVSDDKAQHGLLAHREIEPC